MAHLPREKLPRKHRRVEHERPGGKATKETLTHLQLVCKAAWSYVKKFVVCSQTRTYNKSKYVYII